MSDHLNPQQSDAVHSTQGPLLVLAGAGSGKTRVITHKIAYMILGQGMSARNIVAVTFTNKAADEMRRRLKEMIPAASLKGIRVATFHSLGLQILERHGRLLGYHPPVTVLPSADQKKLLTDVMKDEGIDPGRQPADPLLHIISNLKGAGIHPENFTPGDNPVEAMAARLYPAYQQALQQINAVDFDDLLIQPMRLFEQEPEIRQNLAEGIRHMLVDEYQDTNRAQYQMMRQLVSFHGNLTCVGDDDQSIYGWRGADIQNILKLHDDYPALRIIKLEENYRSSNRILRAANRVISHNTERMEKSLWSQRGDGDAVTLHCAEDDDDEARWIAEQILTFKFKDNARYKDFAVLYRSNQQARILEQHFRAAGIPYKVSGGISFYERAEIRDLISYLRAIANDKDTSALLRIVNTPKRGLGAVAVGHLVQASHRKKISPVEGLYDHEALAALPKAGQEGAKSLGELLANFSFRFEREDLVDTMADLFQNSGLKESILGGGEDMKTIERRLSNVDSLLESVAYYRDTSEDPPTLAGFLQRISLQSDLDRRKEEERDEVTLSTIHASKGLEWPYVFIVGVEEELLPHRNALAEDSVEEERRLFYVAITRARYRLAISQGQRRRRGREYGPAYPSPFLDELPDEGMESTGMGRGRSRQHQEHEIKIEKDVFFDKMKNLLASRE